MTGIKVYHAPGLGSEADAAARAVERAFPRVTVAHVTERATPTDARVASRGQVRADLVLEDVARGPPALWLLDEDAFVPGMNFVFGLARAGTGAVVSTARLPDHAMVEKEAVHEVGHLLGLAHCEDECVMRFSNTLEDALEKPRVPCPRCAARVA